MNFEVFPELILVIGIPDILEKRRCVSLLFFCKNNAALIKYLIDVVKEESLVVVIPVLIKSVLILQQKKFVVVSVGLDLAICIFEIFLRNHILERILF